MFAFIDTDSFLHRRNPVIKLALILLISVLVSTSYFPVLPFATFLLSFFCIWIFGHIPFLDLLRRLGIFLAVSMIFMISMLVLRGLDREETAVAGFLFLRWSQSDLIHSLSLGLRILALVTLSMGFVLTTKPRDLVLSLIQNCHVSPVHGYAVMATYRFLPELREQVDAIHLAQEIRGIPWNRGIMTRFTSPFRVLLPLLCIAARRGERLACAMECRALGNAKQRTNYMEIRLEKADWIFLVAAVLCYLLLILLLARLGVYHFSFAAIR